MSLFETRKTCSLLQVSTNCESEVRRVEHESLSCDLPGKRNFSAKYLQRSRLRVNLMCEKGLLLRFRILELQNRIMQNDVTFRVTKPKVKFLLFHFQVNNSMLKNKKFHLELLTRSGKIKSPTSSY